MTRAVLVAIGLSMFNTKAEMPSNIQSLVDKILNAASAEPALARVETLQQTSATLRFQFPGEAKRLALEAENDLSANDDYRRSRIYQLMLDLDASEAVRVGKRIRDKDVLYSAELQHCVENRNVRCARDVLVTAFDAGAYRIRGTSWVVDKLVITDPAAARAVFLRVLTHFPAKTAGFQDVEVLLTSAESIASYDLQLARRAAEAIRAVVTDPHFEDRTDEIVLAQFLVKGQRIQTTNTHETVLTEVDSLLEHGTFSRPVAMHFALKHPNVATMNVASPDPAVDTLLQKLKNQVEQLNDFSLKDLSGRSYALKALRGRPVLLSFWATWCAPCRQEMPKLAALERKGLIVLAITDEDEQVVRNYVAAKGYSFTILLDPQGESFRLYDVIPRPTNILFNGAGQITGRWTGLPEDKISEALKSAGTAVNPSHSVRELKSIN